MKWFSILLVLSLLHVCQSSAGQQKTLVGGGCDGCDLIYEGMPKSLNWETTIPDAKEPGEPMEISGTIYQVDGKTPAAGVILYVYQTDAGGVYKPAAGQTAGRMHGRLRGWMKTDGKGRYKFRTIRPGAYPGRKDPAHIHPVVKEPDKNEYYIDEFRFDDDPLLTKEEREREEKRGGSGVIKLTKNQNGVWVGHRDIVLGYNIPSYK
ncbi:MAG: intradiol ring-cleavage dioxygenase [Acidobacteriota bacterium]|nr:intradiol ring-cleavage dioxygenase [Acidobacteriota bacterium]